MLNLSECPAVREFLSEFDVPGITFKTERISQGEDACVFTWDVAVSGVDGSTKGVSFYGLDARSKKIGYIRDIPQPVFSPPPLQAIAGAVHSALRRWKAVE